MSSMNLLVSREQHQLAERYLTWYEVDARECIACGAECPETAVSDPAWIIELQPGRDPEQPQLARIYCPACAQKVVSVERENI